MKGSDDEVHPYGHACAARHCGEPARSRASARARRHRASAAGADARPDDQRRDAAPGQHRRPPTRCSTSRSAQFEANPWITVESEEYNWTAPTFTAALAAGTLPTSSRSLHRRQGLIEQHQIVNIDARVQALPYVDKFNPNVLVNGQDADGKIFGRPDRRRTACR